MYEQNNIFAKILAGDIPCQKVAENDQALAFYDVNPQAPIHILVIPKGSYVSFADFSAQATPEEVLGFVRLVGEVAKTQGLEDTGYRLLTNHGQDAHQEVPHFHVHICGGRSLGPLLSTP